MCGAGCLCVGLEKAQTQGMGAAGRAPSRGCVPHGAVSLMGLGPTKGQGSPMGVQAPLRGRFPSRRRLAGPREDSSGGGSVAEFQKIRACSTSAGLEPAKTRGPSGAVGHCPGSVPMAPLGAAAWCLLSIRWL